jgi:uncharacterized membrane protein YphA (DoxX/SURF4 family)
MTSLTTVLAVFQPGFSPSAEVLLRIAYGVLLLAQLALTAPQTVRFFCTERYGGYVESSRRRDVLHRPPLMIAAMVLWILAALALLVGVFPLAAALVNFAFARYFFIATRWKSILRGMGAPGHMNYWLASLIVLLQLADAFDAGGLLRSATVVTYRIDFALIMISAGIYKFTAGYPQNEGMERGLVNPYWGFWSTLYNRLPPRDPVFRVLNHLAYLTEILCGIAMLFAPTALWGAAALAGSFIFIGVNIRLGFLAEMVVVCCLLYIRPGDPADVLVNRIFHAAAAQPVSTGPGAWLALALAALVLAYLCLLPFSYVGMYVNFYGKRRFPGALQRFLDAWTRSFGLQIWRVFTIDVTDFYVLAGVRTRTGEERPYLRMRAFDRATGFRYMHVGEFICLASIFTTLKYYPEDQALFERRLLRYARSVPHQPSEIVVFRYFSIQKLATYEHRLVREFACDTAAGTVAETFVDPSFEVRRGASVSPVHPGSVPGSYAPPLKAGR